MNATDFTVAKHESHHAAAGVFTGRKILAVKRYGMFRVAKGHGVTEFAIDYGDLPREVHRSLVCLWAGVLGAPRGAEADMRVIEDIRRNGLGVEVDLAKAWTGQMLLDPRYREIRYAIETALLSKPWLSGEDVERALAGS